MIIEICSSNDSFNFPLGRIKSIVIVIAVIVTFPQQISHANQVVRIVTTVCYHTFYKGVFFTKVFF